MSVRFSANWQGTRREKEKRGDFEDHDPVMEALILP